MKENMVQKNQEEKENIMNELDIINEIDINQSLGIEPVGNKNGKELNDFKDTLLYLIKFDTDVQEAIKKFIL